MFKSSCSCSVVKNNSSLQWWQLWRMSAFFICFLVHFLTARYTCPLQVRALGSTLYSPEIFLRHMVWKPLGIRNSLGPAMKKDQPQQGTSPTSLLTTTHSVYMKHSLTLAHILICIQSMLFCHTVLYSYRNCWWVMPLPLPLPLPSAFLGSALSWFKH